MLIFIYAGISYHQEHPKELNYKRSTCVVHTLIHQNQTCKACHSTCTYFLVRCIVQLTEDSIFMSNATIQNERTYFSKDEAFKQAAQYQIYLEIKMHINSVKCCFRQI